MCEVRHPQAASAASYGREGVWLSLTHAEAYEKYADELVRFATGLVGPDDAADVVADVFVKVFRSRFWAGVERERSYLYRMVLNQARMHHRSTMRRRAREMKTATRESGYEPEVRSEILERLAVLTPTQRAAVVLTYWEDLSPSQVAERLGMSEGSVRRHLARARAKLREVLDV